MGKDVVVFPGSLQKQIKLLRSYTSRQLQGKQNILHAKQIDSRGLHAQEDPSLSEASTSEFCEAARSIYGEIIFFNEENYAQPPGFHTKSFWN